MRSLWEGKTYAKNTTSPLNLCHILKRGLDLSILKIWGLLVKGLQSYQLSKLEVTRKSLPSGPGPSRISRPGFDVYRGQIILKVWWLVTLQPFNLQTPNFQHWNIYLFFKLCQNFKGLAAFLGWVLPCQIDLILIVFIY